MVHAGGVYLPGVYLPGGCTCQGGVPAGGVYLPGGCTCPGGGVPARGGVYHVTYPIMHLMLPVCCLLTN